MAISKSKSQGLISENISDSRNLYNFAVK